LVRWSFGLRFRYLVAPFKYAVSSRDSYFSIVPVKLVLSVLSVTIVVRVIELGGNGYGVSALFFISVFSSLLAGYISPFFSRFGYRLTRVIKSLVLIGLFSIYIQLRGGLFATLLSSFILFFILNLLLYLVYVDVGSGFFRDKWSYLSRLESVGGFYWVVGLGLGLFLSFIFGYLWNYALASIFLVFYLFLGSSSNRFGVESRREAVYGVRRLRLKYLLIDVFLINFGLSLAYTQIFPYLSSLGALDWYIYALSFIASLGSLFTYAYVGDHFKGVGSLYRGLLVRLGAYISLLGLIVFGGIYPLYASPFIFILIGYSWAYITISLGSYILMYKDKYLSKLYLASGLGGGLGALASGLAVVFLGYDFVLLFSIGVLILSIFLVRRFRIYPASRAVFLRMVVVEHVRLRGRLASRV